MAAYRPVYAADRPLVPMCAAFELIPPIGYEQSGDWLAPYGSGRTMWAAPVPTIAHSAPAPDTHNP